VLIERFETLQKTHGPNSTRESEPFDVIRMILALFFWLTCAIIPRSSTNYGDGLELKITFKLRGKREVNCESKIPLFAGDSFWARVARIFRFLRASR
jgi:hypothetical protein